MESDRQDAERRHEELIRALAGIEEAIRLRVIDVGSSIKIESPEIEIHGPVTSSGNVIERGAGAGTQREFQLGDRVRSKNFSVKGVIECIDTTGGGFVVREFETFPARTVWFAKDEIELIDGGL